MSSFDISRMLERWPYEAGQLQVRKFKGRDGVRKIQLRLDLGVLQMNATGRPDGKRPFGKESFFKHCVALRAKHTRNHAGVAASFRLNDEQCARLQQEAIQYHHRYICLFQLEDYEGVLRDTARNTEVIQFVTEHAPSDEAAWAMQQFYPQLLLMQTRARGTLALVAQDHERAITAVEEGIETLKRFGRDSARAEAIERTGELQCLESWLADLIARRPLSPRETLEKQLADAVASEDYEQAAKVRDQLRNLKSK
jgi:hypothetical protein